MKTVGVGVEGPSDFQFWNKILHKHFRGWQFDIRNMKNRDKLVRATPDLIDEFRALKRRAAFILLDRDRDPCNQAVRFKGRWHDSSGLVPSCHQCSGALGATQPGVGPAKNRRPDGVAPGSGHGRPRQAVRQVRGRTGDWGPSRVCPGSTALADSMTSGMGAAIAGFDMALLA
jgi:hypothetical protein